MQEDLPVDHLVRLACIKETEAQQIYLRAAEITEDAAATMLLKQLAAEEFAHREGLEKLCRSCICIDDEQAEKIGRDFGSENSPLSADSSFCDVIRYAMYREEQAIGFYDRLAAAVQDGPVRQFLTERAGDERQHKARLVALCENLAI